jgi:hypothetical protein
VDPRAGLDRRGEEKILDHTVARTPIPLLSSQYPVVIPTDYKQMMKKRQNNRQKKEDAYYLLPHLNIYLPASRRYSPGEPWPPLQPVPTALSLILLFPSFHLHLLSLSTSSVHLILGLPFRLLEYSLPFNFLFGIALSSIPSTCHLIIFLGVKLNKICRRGFCLIHYKRAYFLFSLAPRLDPISGPIILLSEHYWRPSLRK